MSSVDDLRAALVGRTLKRIERTVNGYEFIFEDGATVRFCDEWLELTPGKAEGDVGKAGGTGKGAG